MIILFFAYCILYLSFRSKMKCKNMCYLATVLFSLLGFLYIPSEGADLNLRFRVLDEIKNNGFGVLNADLYWSGEYGFKYFLLLVSKFPYNNFLPFFSALIGYSFVSATVLKIGKRFSLSNIKKKEILFCTLCFVNFDSMVNGIRNQLAASILVFFLSVYILENKHRLLCYFAFVLCITIHPACIIPVAVFIVSRFMKQKKIRFVVLLFALWPIIITAILYVFSKMGNIPIIYTIYRLLFDYTLNENATHNIVPNLYYAVRMVVRTQSISGILLCALYMKNHYANSINYIISEKRIDYQHVYVFIFALSAVMAGALGTYHVFLRIALFILSFAPVILGLYFSCTREKAILCINDKLQISYISICAVLSLAYNLVAYVNQIHFGFILIK